jgi:hypothetical protein
MKNPLSDTLSGLPITIGYRPVQTVQGGALKGGAFRSRRSRNRSCVLSLKEERSRNYFFLAFFLPFFLATFFFAFFLAAMIKSPVHESLGYV